MAKPVSSASLEESSLFRGNTVAPGELVTFFGRNLSPNAVVTLDGITAPILYSDAGQINAVAPFEINSPTTKVTVGGVASFNLSVAPSVPAIFTAAANGSGQAAALNQDGTMNAESTPALAGSNVTVYITGAGVMTPPINDGAPGPLQPPYPAPVLKVKVRVGGTTPTNGTDAPVQFAQQIPGLIAGVVEIGFQIPTGTPSGDALLTVQVGDATTTSATTIVVQ